MFRNRHNTVLAFLLSTVALIAGIDGASSAGEAGGSEGAGAEYAAITRVVDRYVEAMQKGSSSEIKAVYLPQASFYFFREGKMVGGPIELLHKMVEGNPIPAPIEYNVTAVNISGPIATVTLDLTNIGGVHIIDMFTLIKDGDSWMIASKVARRPGQ